MTTLQVVLAWHHKWCSYFIFGAVCCELHKSQFPFLYLGRTEQPQKEKPSLNEEAALQDEICNAGGSWTISRREMERSQWESMTSWSHNVVNFFAASLKCGCLGVRATVAIQVKFFEIWLEIRLHPQFGSFVPRVEPTISNVLNKIFHKL